MSTHNQPVVDPVAHFKAIDWCDKLLSDKSVLGVVIPNRTINPSTEQQFINVTLNTLDTVRACVLFFRMPSREERQGNVGETQDNPFVELNCLLDVGEGVASRPHIMHGGVYSVVLDEVLSTLADRHSKHGAFTANLNVSLKKSLALPAITLCKGRVVRREGRKCYIKGSFHDSEGAVLAEAEGLWILVNGEAKL